MNDRSPPRLLRRGQMPAWAYKCHECGRKDAPALVEFCIVVGGSDGNYDGEYLACFECLSRARDLFFDPALVETKTPMFSFEKEIRDFATKMHGDQKYDSGAAPYILHLAAVRDAIIEFGFGPPNETFGENYVAAAWLHDVLEDTPAKPSDVSSRFGGVTLKFVWAVTGTGKNRKERNEDAYRKMEKEPHAIPLKLADRICNTRASKISSPDKLFKMYAEEYASFRTRLRGPSLTHVPHCRPMWDHLDEISKDEERKGAKT